MKMGAMLAERWKKLREDYTQLVRVSPNLFEQNVLQRADNILGQSDLAEAVVQEIIEQISYLKPKQIDNFLREGITDDTFLYHRERVVFENQRALVIPKTYFHINASSFLSTATHLIPKYIFEGKECISIFGNSDAYLRFQWDDYEVNFATGCIGDLAIFQAGCVFSDPKNEDNEAFDPNNQIHNIPFGVYSLVGIVASHERNFIADSPDHQVTKGGHGINTGYLGDEPSRKDIPRIVSKREAVEVTSANFSVKLDSFLALPYIVWTPQEIASKIQEAAGIYNGGKATMRGVSSYLGTLEQFTNHYVAERQLESIILYTLHKFSKKIKAKSLPEEKI